MAYQRKKPQSEYTEEAVDIRRVMRVVKGGRRMSFRATVVAGNHKGKIGIGMGKASEVAEAIRKATTNAKRHIYQVVLNEGTISYPVNSKYKSSRIILLPASKGTGIIAGGVVRRILNLAGVENILSKMHGSRNKLNMAQATVQGLIDIKHSK